jgi:hypothetical protein
MEKICLLISLLLLLACVSACSATMPRQCNYSRPQANYNEDYYRCEMLAQTKLQNTGDTKSMGGMVPLWHSDCMAQLGWQTCR